MLNGSMFRANEHFNYILRSIFRTHSRKKRLSPVLPTSDMLKHITQRSLHVTLRVRLGPRHCSRETGFLCSTETLHTAKQLSIGN